MKYVVIALFLLFANLSKAQIVSIPDSNFKAALIARGVDLNNDGDIQQSEAAAVTQLEILEESANITSMIGINSFTSLQRLTVSSQPLSFLDVSNNNSLVDLDCRGNKLTLLNTSSCSNLKSLFCSGNRLAVMDFSNLPNLDTLNHKVQMVEVISLNVSYCAKLRTLDCNYIGSGSPSLLNVSYCNSITNLSLSPNRDIQTAKILYLPNLVNLQFYGVIKNLIISDCPLLTSILPMGGFNAVSEFFDIKRCFELSKISLYSAQFANPLDLSSFPNLQEVDMYFLRTPSINLKNGTRMAHCNIGLSDIGPNAPPRSILICADEFEIDSASSWLRVENYYNNVSYQLNSYCSFTPAGSFNTINGKVKMDLNNNGCGVEDIIMPGTPLRIRDTSGYNIIKYVYASGDYVHYTYKGLFTLTPYFPYPYFTINPSSATVAFDTANSLSAIRNFCIQPNGVHNDLEISFLPSWPPARPGFNAAYTMVYKNRGTTTLSANVQVNFDNGKMNFVNASIPVTTQSAGQLVWNYNNLQPFESKSIQVTFNLLPPPINNINDTLTYLAAITPNSADETPYDNSFILPQRIVGSYDPNDKQCIEGSRLNIAKIGDYLHYQIRFQNEGTDTAFNIVVADTLSNKYDWNSFEYLGSSHTADVKLTNNKLEFIFQNIKLPQKAINEPASHGWLAFKIKPKATVVGGDSLNNKAAIYFDFNAPIITNKATTVITNTSAPVPVKLEYLSVSKSSQTNLLNWKAACSNGSATFSIERSADALHFASIGSITATALRCQLPLSYTDNNPLTGKNHYRLKITDADGVIFYSKIVSIGNDKAGVEIAAIVNNTVYINSNKAQAIQIKVIAADGRIVYSDSKKLNAGNNQINILINKLAKGVYTLVANGVNGQLVIQRFVQ